MSEDAAKIYEQQSSRLWEWSKFYHDAEIKVNTSALAISSIATLAEKFLDQKGATTIRLFCWDLNLVGVVVILSSVAALISTLGYWRYYEFCDLYAKQFRDAWLADANLKDKFDKIKESLDSKFNENSRVLSKVPVHAHHVIWIVTQLLFLLVGFRLVSVTS